MKAREDSICWKRVWIQIVGLATSQRTVAGGSPRPARPRPDRQQVWRSTGCRAQPPDGDCPGHHALRVGAGKTKVKGEYQRATNHTGRSTSGAFQSNPARHCHSSLTPPRALLNHRQARFTQRLYARPRDGNSQRRSSPWSSPPSLRASEQSPPYALERRSRPKSGQGQRWIQAILGSIKSYPHFSLQLRNLCIAGTTS